MSTIYSLLNWATGIAKRAAYTDKEDYNGYLDDYYARMRKKYPGEFEDKPATHIFGSNTPLPKTSILHNDPRSKQELAEEAWIRNAQKQQAYRRIGRAEAAYNETVPSKDSGGVLNRIVGLVTEGRNPFNDTYKAYDPSNPAHVAAKQRLDTAKQIQKIEQREYGDPSMTAAEAADQYVENMDPHRVRELATQTGNRSLKPAEVQELIMRKNLPQQVAQAPQPPQTAPAPQPPQAAPSPAIDKNASMHDTLQSRALIDAITKEQRHPFLVSDVLGKVLGYTAGGGGVIGGAIAGAGKASRNTKSRIASAVLGSLLGGTVGGLGGAATGNTVGLPVDLVRHWIYD